MDIGKKNSLFINKIAGMIRYFFGTKVTFIGQLIFVINDFFVIIINSIYIYYNMMILNYEMKL